MKLWWFFLIFGQTNFCLKVWIFFHFIRSDFIRSWGHKLKKRNLLLIQMKIRLNIRKAILRGVMNRKIKMSCSSCCVTIRCEKSQMFCLFYLLFGYSYDAFNLRAFILFLNTEQQFYFFLKSLLTEVLTLMSDVNPDFSRTVKICSTFLFRNILLCYVWKEYGNGCIIRGF